MDGVGTRSPGVDVALGGKPPAARDGGRVGWPGTSDTFTGCGAVRVSSSIGTVTAGPDPSTRPITTQLPAIERLAALTTPGAVAGLAQVQVEVPTSGRPRGVNRRATRAAGQSSPES